MRGKPVRFIGLAECYDIFMAQSQKEEDYDKFSNFRARVLEPALKDINTYSELKVTSSFIKEGQTITHINFNIQDLSKSTATLDEADSRFRNVERELYVLSPGACS